MERSSVHIDRGVFLARSRELRKRVSDVASELGFAFIDTTDTIIAASKTEFVHGEKDPQHFKQARIRDRGRYSVSGRGESQIERFRVDIARGWVLRSGGRSGVGACTRINLRRTLCARRIMWEMSASAKGGYPVGKRCKRQPNRLQTPAGTGVVLGRGDELTI